MGWWRIDPETGRPLEDGGSRLSRPPDLVVLNAVSGVDDPEGAHYLGDGPADMASDTARQMAELLGAGARLSAEDARRLLHDRAAPRKAPAGARRGLLKIADELWPDIDDCYDFDWGRPARPAERRWVVEHVIGSLAHRGVVPGEND
jgi:hypothetical protein